MQLCTAQLHLSCLPYVLQLLCAIIVCMNTCVIQLWHVVRQRSFNDQVRQSIQRTPILAQPDQTPSPGSYSHPKKSTCVLNLLQGIAMTAIRQSTHTWRPNGVPLACHPTTFLLTLMKLNNKAEGKGYTRQNHQLIQYSSCSGKGYWAMLWSDGLVRVCL